MEPVNSREERLSLSEKRDMMFEIFRTNIRMLRHYTGVSAVQMAEDISLKTSLSGKRIIDIEYGRGNPTTEEIIAIAQYHNVSVGDLLQREAKVSFVDEINGLAYVVMKAEVYKNSI